MALQRILALIVLFLGACTTGSASDDGVTRPQGAGTGEVKAHVHLVNGDATIRAANGFAFKASPGMPLLNNDEVEAPLGGFVVLRLSNKYLVRIDEEIALKVADLVLLNAPEARESFHDQLNRLLSNQEQKNPERIAGWHARLSGAKTVPTQVVQDEAKRRTRSREGRKYKHKDMKAFGQAETVARVAPQPMAPPADTITTQADREEEQTDVVDKRKGRGSREGASLKEIGGLGKRDMDEIAGDGPGSGVNAKSLPEPSSPPKPRPPAKKPPSVSKAEESLRMAPVAWQTLIGGKLETPAQPAPALVTAMLRDGALRNCLEGEIKRLGLKLARVKIMIRLKGHKVVRIRTGDGLPTPVCIPEHYMNNQVTQGPADGWILFEVPLP